MDPQKGDDNSEAGKLKRVLEQQVAEYEAIWHSIGDGLIVSDKEGHVVLINDVAKGLLGWVDQTVVGKLVTEVVPLVQVKEGLVPSLEEEKTESVLVVSSAHNEPMTTYYLVRNDGTKFPAKITASSIIVDRQVAGTVIVFRDISQEKEIEREKSDFISISSHQLRTPLGSIKWNLEMLSNGEFGKLPEKARGVIGQIMESNQRMINIVTDLLSVSRIESGRTVNKQELTEVAPIVSSAIEETQVLAKDHTVTVSCRTVAGQEPQVMVDPKLFHEVVENLLTNAIKYNRVGGTVEVYVTQVGDKIQVSVADTGEGIPKGEQSRIFTKFFRGDDAIRGDTDGTGLGLFVAKNYVELWGGRIWFESEVGKGTIFHIELPVAKY